jgi:hypothetical protein
MRNSCSCSVLQARIEIAMVCLQMSFSAVLSLFDHGLRALEMMRQKSVMEKIVTTACLRLPYTCRI